MRKSVENVMGKDRFDICTENNRNKNEIFKFSIFFSRTTSVLQNSFCSDQYYVREVPLSGRYGLVKKVFQK